MKILFIKTLKPRNPLVALAHRRQAGAHVPRKPRQQARHELRRELTAMSTRCATRSPPPTP